MNQVEILLDQLNKMSIDQEERIEKVIEINNLRVNKIN